MLRPSNRVVDPDPLIPNVFKKFTGTVNNMDFYTIFEIYSQQKC
jgi:hypothetical protein